MIKLFLITFFLIQNVDTTSIDTVTVKQTISELEQDHQIEMLKTKIESLESSTDRILNALYVTITLIVAIFFGTNFYNIFTQSRKNRELFDRQATELKKDINNSVTERLNAIPTEEIKVLKKKVDDISNERLRDKIEYLKEICEFTTSYSQELQYMILYNLLNYSFIYYKNHPHRAYGHDVRTALGGWIKFLKNKNPLPASTKDNLLRLLSDDTFKDFSDTQTVINLLMAE